MPSVTTPNMDLVVPTPGEEPGPEFATDINNDLVMIDAHDHSSGKGVQITPAGINVTTDLSFASNNAILLRSCRFVPQGTPLSGASDLNCVYTAGVDLYYNDGNGNQIRITQSGGIVGTSGSIAGLVSPASAVFASVGGKFTWESNVSVAATMDMGPVIIRDIAASANGITIESPISLAAAYTITLLPSLPANNSFLAISTGGQLSTISQSGGITGSNIGSQTITRDNLASVGQQVSSSCGAFTTTSQGFTDVTNLSVSITTSGRPVIIMMIPDGTNSSSGIQFESNVSNATGVAGYLQVLRGTTSLGAILLGATFPLGTSGNVGTRVYISPSAVFALDPVSAGTYTYKLQMSSAGGANYPASVNYCQLIAYEL